VVLLEPRPVGKITIFDERGYAYLPKIIRKEVGADGKDEIPFFIDANCVLLVRKGAELEDVLEGIEILKRDLMLRAGRNESDNNDDNGDSGDNDDNDDSGGGGGSGGRRKGKGGGEGRG
jgi:bifunctional DNA-binding transcriptional regulator/antitoxin component of YhaV-PrlF toxin-antitoxin module